MSTTAAQDGSAPRRDIAAVVRGLLETIALVVAPPTVVVGLLLYFGWVRTNALFSDFGIDPRLLDYDREDYLLRSAGSAFRPAVVLLSIVGGLVLCFALLRWLVGRLNLRQGRRLLGAVGAAGGLALLLALGLVLGVETLAPSPAVGALLLATGAALLETVAILAGWRQLLVVRRILVGALVLVGCFWSFAVTAQANGDRLAQAWAADPTLRPSVALTSLEDLAIDGPGVEVERDNVRTTNSDGRSVTVERYRYTGLRLLIYSNERWFLLPERWGEGGVRVAFVLRDSPDLTVEMMPPAR